MSVELHIYPGIDTVETSNTTHWSAYFISHVCILALVLLKRGIPRNRRNYIVVEFEVEISDGCEILWGTVNTGIYLRLYEQMVSR